MNFFKSKMAMMLDPCKSVYCFMAYTQNASWFLEIAGSTGKPNNVEKSNIAL